MVEVVEGGRPDDGRDASLALLKHAATPSHVLARPSPPAPLQQKNAGDAAPAPSVLFDESGHFLIYPTLLGIKVVNLETNAISRLLGKVENTERFLGLALYQGVPKKVRRLDGGCVWRGRGVGGGGEGRSKLLSA